MSAAQRLARLVNRLQRLSEVLSQHGTPGQTSPSVSQVIACLEGQTSTLASIVEQGQQPVQPRRPRRRF